MWFYKSAKDLKFEIRASEWAGAKIQVPTNHLLPSPSFSRNWFVVAMSGITGQGQPVASQFPEIPTYLPPVDLEAAIEEYNSFLNAAVGLRLQTNAACAARRESMPGIILLNPCNISPIFWLQLRK